MQCLRCSKPFVKAAKARTQKFCSKRCREKHWAENNRAYASQKQKKYRRQRYEEDGFWRQSGPKAQALADWMVEIKSKSCSDCDGFFPICAMDFDHREGTEKKYNVGSMFAHHYSRELIESELAKCDLVCANCHRVRTRDRKLGSGGGISRYAENRSLESRNDRK